MPGTIAEGITIGLGIGLAVVVIGMACWFFYEFALKEGL